ncbi:hypothetical protein ACEWY4_010065 [Coilia grayii]|uniref:Uncharacterized protein n=1 Tax=Coilia grayii TaxID=363190 RepID=A0ABD1K8D4_9TELE
MGNAAITIHHPTSLDHGIPYLESGKIVDSTSSMIRLEKRDGAAVGCGGRVVFKKNVLESQWTYRITKEISSHFEIGTEMTVEASKEVEANQKIATKFGMSWSEVRESVTLIKSQINDKNAYSELYCYVSYNGQNVGEVYWTRNDLNLKHSHRWAENSEMIIDINFEKKL